MSLTKETIGATVRQGAGRQQAPAGKKTGDTGHPQPVCIEVPVTVQGVRPATDPGKREPFTESARTIIVFANGAVLRLGTSVNPGQLIFLTNEHTRKEVVCQVVKSKTYNNVPGYVELEFTEPNPGFWGIHFPGEPSAPQSEPQSPGARQPANTAPPSVPPVKAAEGEGAPRIEPRPASAVATTVRQEPSGPETHPPSPSGRPSPVYPELIRPALAGSPQGREDAGVSEPLVFSHAKRPVAPTPSRSAPPASLAQPRGREDERVVPSFGRGSLFEERAEAEMEAANEKTRRVPVGALIAAGLILAAAGGGWYWWRSSGHAGAAYSASQSANAAALVTPPAVSTQTALPPSSPLLSSSAPSASETSKSVEASGHPAAPASAQPLNTSLTSRETSRPAEKPAESREPATKAEKKSAFADFRLSTPTVVHPASRPRNLDPAPHLDSAPAAPAAASPDVINSLVGSTLQPEAPKPEPRAGGELKQARLVSSIPPGYPPLARSQRVEGDVTMDALIDATGRVTTIKIISGPVLLQQAAAAALRQWKYEPASLNGKPVAMHLVVVVKFRLR